jgi:hypothetical protein
VRSSWGAGAVLAVACIGGLAALLAPAAACTPHDCDPTTSTFDMATQGVKTVGDGGFVLWASGAVAGPWINYPGGLTITVTLPAGFVPVQPPAVYVSTGVDQDAGATSTLISGQAAEITYLSNSSFELDNGSCADYDVWFSILGTMTAGTGDAGSDAARD